MNQSSTIIYSTHEQVRIHVSISQEMVGIIGKMLSCLTTRQLDGREIHTQWPEFSGIALAVGAVHGFL